VPAAKVEDLRRMREGTRTVVRMERRMRRRRLRVRGGWRHS
jgi:hypothetical protein